MEQYNANAAAQVGGSAMLKDYKDYAEQERAMPGAIQGANRARDKPTLHFKLEQLLKGLAVVHEQHTRIENACLRLTGARETSTPPAQLTKLRADTPAPAETIEQRIDQLMHFTELLHARVAQAAAHLESAV